MKKILLIGCCFVSILTGCQAAEDNQTPLTVDADNYFNVGEQKENFNTLNYSSDNENDDRNRFGYVRHQEGTSALRDRDDEMMYYDRELLADYISRLSLNLPGVHDVATLVTDELVLVAYQADTDDRVTTADQVKHTAYSVVPRFYNVYVSDQPRMIEDIERYSGLEKSEEISNSLNQTINEMIISPQGRNLEKRNNNTRPKNDVTGR